MSEAMFDAPHEPVALDAERAVLGLMFHSPAAADLAFTRLQSADFYLPAHMEIFTVMSGLYMRGEPVEPQAVVMEATRVGLLPRLPGQANYIIELYTSATVPQSIGYYADAIIDTARKRRLARAGLQVRQHAMNPTVDAESAASYALDTITGAAAEHLPDTAVTAADAMALAIDRADGLANGTIARVGLRMGYPELDHLTGGIHPGQLVLVAGRPGLGKSVVALDIARAAAISQHRPVLLFSLEMSRLEIGQRLTAAVAGVPLMHLIQGSLTENQRHAVDRALEQVRTAPLYIDDAPNMTAADLRAKAARLARKDGLDLIIVDYLQLMSPPNGQRFESRQVMVAELSRDLKLLAKQVAPVVALAQLNRGPEARADRKPQMADLRDSGALEQDADLVILVHREDAYDKESPRAGEVDLILDKHRNGPTGIETLASQYHYARLTPMMSSY